MAKRLVTVLALTLVFVLTACGGNQPSSVASVASSCANNAVQVSIVYAPESDLYLPQVIADFNNAFVQGRNPVTGAALASGEQTVCVTGRSGSSGTVMQGIVNAIIAPGNSNVERPTIFSPSVSHWLALANFQSGRQLFDLAAARPTALAPVVMAIWESRLNAIRETVGYDTIGWEELIDVFNSPNGWCDYNLPNCRRTVYYGHTDPLISSTALSTLISEFYAAARENGIDEERLTLSTVRSETVQESVRQIESLIRHYSSRTTEFIEYIAQGPEYLDFVALEENDLIRINRGLTAIQPPERLVALYPKEGTFWHEHPMGVVNADWTTPEQRAAANVFIDYVLTAPVQEVVMENGFRPANPDVELGFPFVAENGIDPAGPTRILNVPAPDVIAAVQQSWAFVKKQADITLLIDVSGSMGNEGKIDQAREAAEAFLRGMETNNRVSLAVFSDDVRVLVPLDDVESNFEAMYSNIRSLRANGGTELFQALTTIATDLTAATEDEDRIRAIVVLSDGADTGDAGFTLNDAIEAIEASRNTLNPVIVIPVAYGSDADVNALNAIARASATRVQSGDASSISRILEIISSYF
ncbi:MAG: substrate-binding domain-containing protein [Pleurocapsa minor GSE-CHR-MK-17-07R]|jgi:Ca-activated chloride channel family protein|nr:substrate-binding domain-containing protein [Pleurocapsa minor GSE-CHR-MK 17-07R]